ncbi:penicillin acylase family protein [Paracoccus sp. Z118]|uniref:penicillin acylase family protein n=1 Tax=Paracoccus sp. Z118 TaxID=2851017 RepID=UPI001C2BF634|nr:penicillin acylase family protein [Paracoccus sp. Z118]MBV0893087.1 penicillin acylase family protein [Paracoccus sp. Z118]
MLTLFRWLVRLTVGLLVGAVLAVTLAWYFAVRSLPDYQAAHQVQGIVAPVEIVRTTDNVPHIFAGSDHDAFFALGLAHAQDRLFQMTVLRRAAQGRLSELYGPRTYAADDLARRLGLWRHAQASLDSQDERTMAALSAYADGVNAWIGLVNEGARGRGAPEFFVLPGDIAYWQPADSLAILKLLAAGATDQIAAEVLRARLSIAAPERGQEVVAEAGEPALPAYASLFGNAHLPSPDRIAGPTPDGWFAGLAGFVRPGAGASANGFAAAPERTAAGAPLLANDPHVALTAPSLWYLARIELAPGGVIGGTVPGIPAVLSGRNPALAWGLTPARIDDQDLVMEEVQPGDSTRYRGLRGWTDFSTRTEIIRVRDGADQTITLRETENGPVIPGGHFNLSTITPAGHVAALRWTGLADDDTTMTALVGLMMAGDIGAAKTAVRGINAPAVQVTLADQDGIAQTLAGAVPLRNPAQPASGAMPVPGWQAEGRWQGLLPAAAPERDRTADKGIVAATGAEPLNGGGVTAAPHAATGTQGVIDVTIAELLQPAAAMPAQPPQSASILGHDRDGPLRRARLMRLLSAREVHSRDSFIDVQLDTVSPAARALLPLVGADLWFTGEPAAPGTPERQRQDALSLLAEWDGNMSEHLPEPLIASAWLAQLQTRLVHDELGPLTESLSRLQPSFIERVFRDVDGASVWCDVVQSAPVETCTTIARQALDAAILDLTSRFGGDVTSWRWGDVHEARHEHPALGRVPVLRWVVSLLQSTSGGDFTLARAGLAGGEGAANADGRWAQVTGAGYRGVYDLADPDSSVFIISTGQSGHPLSRHYDDLSELWRRGEYIGMSLDPDLARAGAEGVMTLTPVPQ